MRQAGDRVVRAPTAPTRKVRVRSHTRTIKVKAPVPRQRGQSLTDAPRIAQARAQPVFRTEGQQHYRTAFKRNAQFAKPGPYQTRLDPVAEHTFRRWLHAYKVPFNPHARNVDYDMRGYFLHSRGAEHRPGQHFPDTFKTPLDTTFSRESKYATKNNPYEWRGDNLVDNRNDQVVFASPMAHTASKPYKLQGPHDVGTTARPPRRGHAPTIFDEPIGGKKPARTPTQKMQAKQERSTARGLLEATGVHLNRPLKREEVRHVLDSPVAKHLAASAKPYLAKPTQHHGFLHNALHAVESVPAALVMRQNDNLPPRTFFKQSTADKVDRAVQSGLSHANDAVPGLLTTPDPNSPLATPGQKLAATVRHGVAKVVLNEQRATRKFSNPTAASMGPGGKVNPTVKKLVVNTAKDAVDLPANTLESTYLTIAHPEEVAKSTLEQLKHPVKSFVEHPLSTALILRGGEAALSRGLGNISRSGVLGEHAADYASTTRPDLKLTGNAAVQRYASKGLIENRVQKAADRYAIRKGRETTVQSPAGPRKAIQATERQMFKAGPGRPLRGHLNRRLDIDIGTNAGMKSVTRTEALNAMLQQRSLFHALKRDEKSGAQVVRTNGHEDAVPVILEGGLKEGNVTDPAKYGSITDALIADRDRITAHIKVMIEDGARKNAADIKLARDNAARIDHLLNDPMFLHDPSSAFAAATDFVRGHGNSITHDGLEAERIKHGDFTKEQAARRVLLPFAERDLGATHVAADERHAPALERAANLRVLENEAARKVRGAQSALTNAKRDEAAATARAETTAAGRRRAIKSRRLPKEQRLGRTAANQSRIPTPDLTRAQGEQLLKVQGRRGEAERSLTAAKLHHDHVSALSKDAQDEAARLGDAFVGRNGETLSTDHILNEFKARGGNPEHLAYVKRFKQLDNPKSYRGGGGMLQRGGQSKRYTGSGTQGVLYHRSYTALAEQMAHTASRVEHHYGVTGLINTYGYARPGGGLYWDQTSGAKEIERLKEETGHDYVAVTPMRQDVPQSLLDEHRPAELEESFHTPTNPKQHVVLLRKEVVERIKQHEGVRANNDLAQAFQTANQYFRHAVLPTSTKWVAGNVIEALGRTLINDPTIARSMLRGHKLQHALEELGPEGARQLKRLQVGASSGLFTSQQFQDFYRPNEPDFMQSVHAFRQTGGARQIGNAWVKYRNLVVAGNERLESSVYWSALGKEAQREVQSALGSWHKTLLLGKAAYEDVAKGLLDSNNVARYVNAVDKMRGRYSNLSPSGRWAVSTLTPFAPWYVNAIHFAAVTLPAQHPILFASFAAMYLGTQDQRAAEHLPPWAVGSIHGIDVNHYTPFGIYAGGTGGAGQLILPQYSGLIHNLEGEAWTGQKLPKGSKAAVLLNTALGTFIPFTSRVQTVLEKGGTATPDSTLFHPKTKKGSSSTYLAGVKKAVNPFRRQHYGAASDPFDSLLQKYQGTSGAGGPTDDLLKKYGGGG